MGVFQLAKLPGKTGGLLLRGKEVIGAEAYRPVVFDRQGQRFLLVMNLTEV